MQTRPLVGGARAARLRARVRRKRDEIAISVVVPVLDEEAVIARTLARLVSHLEELGASFEILVVDDGSSDRTGEIVLEHAAADRRIRILWLRENFGKGAALRAGMRAAHGRWVLTMDADLATGLDALARACERLARGADVVFGDRRDPRSRLLARQPRVRELLGSAFTRLARACVDTGVRDFTCGFKGYRRRAAREIAARTQIDGWACDVEIAAIARGLGLARSTVPVAWTHVDGSKVEVARACVTSLADLCRIAFRRLVGGYRG